MGRKETFPHIVFINHVDMLPTQNLKLKNRELLKQFFFFLKKNNTVLVDRHEI